MNIKKRNRFMLNEDVEIIQETISVSNKLILNEDDESIADDSDTSSENDTINEIIDGVVKIGDVRYTIHDEDDYEFLQQYIGMKNQVKTNNQPFTWTWILIKLYELSNGGDLNTPVDRQELLEISGITNTDRASTGSEYFKQFRRMGLCQLNGNDVYPLKNLKDFIEGNLELEWDTFDTHKNNSIVHMKLDKVDLTPFVGKNAPSKNSQGSKPKRTHRANKTIEKEKNIMDMIDKFGLTMNGDNVVFTPEQLENIFSSKTESMLESRREKMRKRFKEIWKLPEDHKITKDDLTNYRLNHVCAYENWNPGTIMEDLIEQ